MSGRLEARAEVIKLARVLAVEPDDLSYLEDLPSDELRAFRERATDQLFDSGGKTLQAIGPAAKLLPTGLVANIAQKTFGPLLCARAAGAVDTGKAIDVAKKLPADFLADVTVELDPRKVAAIIAEVPEELVVPVAEEMGRRREDVTMGRFLAYVPDHAIAAAIGVLDDEIMLRTAFVLEHKDRLDHAIGLLPPERLPGILRHAGELDLWPEMLDLLDHISNERRGELADILAQDEPEVIEGLIGAVQEAGIWDSLLPVVRTMSPESRERFASMSPFHDTDVMRSIIHSAAEQDLWLDLVPLIDALPPEVVAEVPAIAAELKPELIERIFERALAAPETIPALVDLIASDPDSVGKFALMPVFHTEEALTAIIDAAAAANLWLKVVPLIDALPDEVQKTAVDVIDSADRELAEKLFEQLDDAETIRTLVDVAPPEIMAAIERAAKRLGMEAELAERLGAI